jgi:hypothetical protein
MARLRNEYIYIYIKLLMRGGGKAASGGGVSHNPHSLHLNPSGISITEVLVIIVRVLNKKNNNN